MTDALLDSDGITRLREALLAADYTTAGVAARLGPAATDAVTCGDLRGALRAEDLRQAVEPPLGDRVAQWFDRQDWLRSTVDLLAARYRAADGIALRQDATLGPGGWQLRRQVLALADGLRWQDEIDPVAVALVAGCDGSLPLRDQLSVLAVAHDVPEDDLVELAAPVVAHLVERGFLTPVSPGGGGRG